MFRLLISKCAAKQIPLLTAAHLDDRLKALLSLISENPFRNPPPYEKLIGDFSGLYSRRINGKHRLVYEVDETAKVIRVLSVWTHYETL